MSDNIILRVENLKKYFPVKSGVFGKTVGNVKAVDDVSFYLKEGETLGLVGESGCGKSTLGRTVIRLYEPTEGSIIYKGQDILKLNGQEMKALRKDMQIIFQDPYSSLNPRMNVYSIISEAMVAHKMYKRGKALQEKVLEIMRTCGLSDYHIFRYPHQFSGGQRQRIGIARALALEPKFVVCDEPVSALDVSIQSQIINLMMDLQDQMGLSYLFISHDLGVVKHISNRIGVMYLGSIIELANKDDLYKNPLHPYTRALLGAIPLPNPEKRRKLHSVEGEIPSNVNPPSGCKFHTRCPYAKDVCKAEVPQSRGIEAGHFVACHFAGEI